MRCLILIYCFLFLVAPQLSAAAGFGVSPSKLDFALEEGSESSRQLILYNTGREARFSIASSSPDVATSPSEGVLPGNGKAIVAVTAYGRKAGNMREVLTVQFYDSAGEKNVVLGLGTAVAVTVDVSEPLSAQASVVVGSLLSLGIVLSGMASYVGIKKLAKAQHL